MYVLSTMQLEIFCTTDGLRLAPFVVAPRALARPAVAAALVGFLAFDVLELSVLDGVLAVLEEVLVLLGVLGVVLLGVALEVALVVAVVVVTLTELPPPPHAVTPRGRASSPAVAAVRDGMDIGGFPLW